MQTKSDEVGRLRGLESELRARASDAESPRAFAAALADPGGVSLIAEVKRRSPGAGEIDASLDPPRRAELYRRGGARAVSVLTDGPFFGGSLDDLRAVKATVALPVLRKDFTIDERQVWEARAAGADAVLLIVRVLDDGRLREFRELAEELGMSALVEVHDAEELDRAVESGASVLGINNRNLRSFVTDVEVTLRLADRVPEAAVLVSESGISRRSDVSRLAEAGVDAVLVGEALVRSPDPAAAARELASVPLPASHRRAP